MFPHTFHWDIISLLAYVYDYQQLRQKFWVTVDKTIPKKFPGNLMFPKYFKPLTTEYSLEAKNKGQTGTGFIKQAVEKLKDEQQYWLLITPEGKRSKSPWRSGWYALAKELEIPIIVVGFDFTEHRMKCPLILNPNWTEIKSGTGTISYHNPEKSITSEYSAVNDNPLHEMEINLADGKNTMEQILQSGMQHIIPLVP